MFRKYIACSAIGVLIATGALAQTTTTEPADPAATDAAAPGLATPPAPLAAELTGDWVIDEGWHPVEIGTISADQLIGANVRNHDGETIAAVDDLILSPDGNAESIAATFGGFLGFGSDAVLLEIDEVEVMQNDAGGLALRTALTPESLEGRVPYEG
jgi:hypothetical protein